MQDYVRERLREAVKAQDGEQSAEDLLRCFAHEATMMMQTEVVVSTLQSDPYEHLDDIKSSVERLCNLLAVTEYEKIQTVTGYSRIVSTVQLKADAKMQKSGVEKYVELYFEYERQGTQSPGQQTSVWYSIDIARDDGPREKVLWVKVFAAGDVPSSLPAKNLDEEEGEWEDIDDEDDVEDAGGSSTSQAESKLKNARLEEAVSEDDEEMVDAKLGEAKEGDVDKADGEEDLMEDRFTAGMDPEALEQFFRWTRLEKMEDATAFFLLMTFPFYELEFDLTGFILDAVFGEEDEEEEAEGGGD